MCVVQKIIMTSPKTSTHIHMIGIGGAGMSAIALYLIERGHEVTGSDRELSSFAKCVESAGGEVYIGHKGNQVLGADLVIRSSAVPEDNEEVIAARAAGIPVFKRSDFLGKVMEGYQGIAVAGTHGKTTTTAMIAWVLTKLGLDPSYIIGGVANNLGANAHAGQSSQFVIEADEYDRMFLGLHPEIAVITNVEYDHPDCFPTPDNFYQAFVEFVGRLAVDGVLLVCSDDRNAISLNEVATDKGKSTISYGLGLISDQAKPDYMGHNLEIQENGSYSFEIIHNEVILAKVFLRVPGRHNVLNALAAFAVSHLLENSPKMVAAALGEFTGVARRFEIRGETDGVVVIDDYAHHPTEIRATLTAARDRYADQELWVVWQPHTYSRTTIYFEEFAHSFQAADHVIVTKIYAAREAARNGEIEGELIKEMDHSDARFIAEMDQISAYLSMHLHPGSVVMVLSAGDAQQIGSSVLEDLCRRTKTLDV